MEQKFKDISQDDIARLVNSPMGKQLIAFLQKQDQAILNQAARQARSGQTQQAKDTLQQVFSSPEIRRLLQQLGGADHG